MLEPMPLYPQTRMNLFLFYFYFGRKNSNPLVRYGSKMEKAMAEKRFDAYQNISYYFYQSPFYLIKKGGAQVIITAPNPRLHDPQLDDDRS